MIVVIADDLTGAAEIAGVCLRYGLKVAFGIDALPLSEAEVSIVATDTRSLTEQQAYDTHFQLAKNIQQRFPNASVFKKCDSALRGFILTETVALLSVFGKQQALIEPANPAIGRCIRNGIYFIADEKLEQTGFAHDPDFPAGTSLVEELLLQRTSKKNAYSNLFTGKITGFTAPGMYLPDCETTDDLRIIATHASEDTIVCGSAAFFEQYLLQLQPTCTIQNNIQVTIKEHFVLVSGTTHPGSRTFASKLVNSGCPHLAFSEPLLEKDVTPNDLDEFSSKAISIYTANRKLILAVSDKVICFEGSSKDLKSRMAMVVTALLQTSKVSELLLEGGATAYQLLAELGEKEFVPINELAPGVVRMLCVSQRGLYITLKPGSYSWPDSFVS